MELPKKHKLISLLLSVLVLLLGTKSVQGGASPLLRSSQKKIGQKSVQGGALPLPRSSQKKHRHLRGAGGGSLHHRRLLSGPYSFHQEIFPAQVSRNDQFGSDIAVDGTTMVVGARFDEGNGAAYVYEKNETGSWVPTAQLLPSLWAQNFGYAVDIRGDTIVVGQFSGKSAYVFEKNPNTGSWDQVSILQPHDRQDSSRAVYFGITVATTGRTVAVGAPYDHEKIFRAGAIYVFERPAQGWPSYMNETQKLMGQDAYKWERLGENGLDIDGDTLVGGARLATDVDLNYTGSAYVFQRTASGLWEEQIELFPPDGTPYQDKFGFGLGISNDVIVVGAYKHDLHLGLYLGNVGGAYVFVRDATESWSFAQKLIVPDASASDGFGIGVAIDGDVLVIGAHGDDDNNRDAGAAFVYHKDLCSNSWTYVSKLKPPYTGRQYRDLFGQRISISGDVVAIGSNSADIVNENGYFVSAGGAAYIFNRVANNAPSIINVTTADVCDLEEDAVVTVRCTDADAVSSDDVLSVTVDWADGNVNFALLCESFDGVFDLSLTHKYGLAGEFNVEITVADSRGETESRNETISVFSNEPPSIINVKVQAEYDVESEVIIIVNCTDANVDVQCDTLLATVDWGDGNKNIDLSSDPDEPLMFTMTHKYDWADDFVVGITIADSHGETDVLNVTVVVFSNEPPSIINVELQDEYDVENDVAIIVNCTDVDVDAGYDTLSATVDWGDGNETINLGPDPNEPLVFTLTHKYGWAENFTVEITVTDSRGESDSRVEKVSVFSNEPPVIESVLYHDWQEFVQNVSFEIHWNDSDLPNDEIHCTFDYGDGVVEVFQPDLGMTTRVHTYPDAGVYTGEVTMTDLRGEFDTQDISLALYDTERKASGEGKFKSLPGFYHGDSRLEGEAKMEFSLKYKNKIPVGGMELKFKNASFQFVAKHLNLLVINQQGRVWLEGYGEVKKDSSKQYSFSMKAMDNLTETAKKDVAGGFGVRIWSGRDAIVYDTNGVVFDTRIEVKTKV